MEKIYRDLKEQLHEMEVITAAMFMYNPSLRERGGVESLPTIASSISFLISNLNNIRAEIINKEIEEDNK